MNVAQFLAEATAKLEKSDVKTARLDCLILLEDILKKDRALLLAHPEIQLNSTQEATLNNYVTQRQKHIPLAYIRGRSAFYGRNFIVNTDVLVPRPESEAVIDLLKEIRLPASLRIVDLGTGSGCLAITAALEIPNSVVWAYDIDAAALTVAQNNAHHFKVNVHAKQQDLLSDSNEQFDVALCNLPYVPVHFPVNQAASHEPKIALFSGDDGLDHFRKLWRQLTNSNNRPLHVITESLVQQHGDQVRLALNAGYRLAKTAGLAQHFTKI